jgi:hypothetical protein
MAEMGLDERIAWRDQWREEARQQAVNAANEARQQAVTAPPRCALHYKCMHVCGGHCAERLNALWGTQQPCARRIGSARRGTACNVVHAPRPKHVVKPPAQHGCRLVGLLA